MVELTKEYAVNCFVAVYGWFRFSGVRVLIGMFICWLSLNFLAGPGIVVIEQVEAEGPAFSDPTTLDIQSVIDRKRNCPAFTQRWVWRWIKKTDGTKWVEGVDAENNKKQQAIPITMTTMPFFADSGEFVLTLPGLNIPDPVDGGWKYRATSHEMCSVLPVQLGQLFGNRVGKSKDVPVNFVGLPHN